MTKVSAQPIYLVLRDIKRLARCLAQEALALQKKTLADPGSLTEIKLGDIDNMLGHMSRLSQEIKSRIAK